MDWITIFATSLIVWLVLLLLHGLQLAGNAFDLRGMKDVPGQPKSRLQRQFQAFWSLFIPAILAIFVGIMIGIATNGFVAGTSEAVFWGTQLVLYSLGLTTFACIAAAVLSQKSIPESTFPAGITADLREAVDSSPLARASEFSNIDSFRARIDVAASKIVERTLGKSRTRETRATLRALLRSLLQSTGSALWGLGRRRNFQQLRRLVPKRQQLTLNWFIYLSTLMSSLEFIAAVTLVSAGKPLIAPIALAALVIQMSLALAFRRWSRGLMVAKTIRRFIIYERQLFAAETVLQHLISLHRDTPAQSSASSPGLGRRLLAILW